MVQDDFHLATAADIVADPSAPDAFVRGIMEGKEWVFQNGSFKEIDYDRTKKALNEAHYHYENRDYSLPYEYIVTKIIL